MVRSIRDTRELCGGSVQRRDACWVKFSVLPVHLVLYVLVSTVAVISTMNHSFIEVDDA